MVLVNISTEDQSEVLERIKQIEGVEETHALWGIYDFMVKITAISFEKIREIIVNSLKRVFGVASTLTLMVIQ